jgi:hypothetical protein
MNGKYQQGSQDNPLDKLKRELGSKPITQFSERELFHPDGYASKVMDYINTSKERKVKITSVQLRKIFHEFKAIVDGLKRENDSRPSEAIEKAMGRLYRLYAILEYQTRREVLDKDFKEIMFKLFDNIEREVNKAKGEIEEAKKEGKEEREKDKEIKDKVIKVFDKGSRLFNGYGSLL